MGDAPALPQISFGERFRVKSRSEKEYVARFLHQDEHSVFVRMDTGEIARFSPERLKWSTYQTADDLLGQSPVQKGDDVLVECGAGSLRGKLASPLGEAMLRLENGLCIQSSDVYALHLMFRAPKLVEGDLFWIQSNSGRSYNGRVLQVLKDNARVRLSTREEVTLRLSSLDINTLFVAVPIPRSTLTGEA